jgi:hypothetical protein
LDNQHDAVLLGGWESPAYWQALIVARRRKLPTIGFFESTLQTSKCASGPIARARLHFFLLLDAVVVPGVAAEEAVLAMDVPRDRIHVGFNAADVKLINRDAEEWRTLISKSVTFLGTNLFSSAD